MSPITLRRNAVKELKNIKKHATGEELGRLLTMLDKLNPLNGFLCIYGLLTGNCYSERTEELIILCSIKSYINNLKTSILDVKPVFLLKEDAISNRKFSCLEYFITKQELETNQKFILKYLS